MTRRVQRDPRSLLELRRLAYRAPRDEDARLVLIDALYESPAISFEQLIERASYWMKRQHTEQAIFLLPKRLAQRRAGSPLILQQNPQRFGFYTTREWEKELAGRIGDEYKNAVLVYRTSTKSRL